MKNINIGEMIKEEVHSQGMSIVEFAKRINCRRSNVYNIFSRSSINTHLLIMISKALNKNFFKYVAGIMDVFLERPSA